VGTILGKPKSRALLSLKYRANSVFSKCFSCDIRRIEDTCQALWVKNVSFGNIGKIIKNKSKHFK
jgi:hypothetical protein